MVDRAEAEEEIRIWLDSSLKKSSSPSRTGWKQCGRGEKVNLAWGFDLKIGAFGRGPGIFDSNLPPHSRDEMCNGHFVFPDDSIRGGHTLRWNVLVHEYSGEREWGEEATKNDT